MIPRKYYTIQELNGVPEDIRVELIDGTLYPMETSTGFHQFWINFIHNAIIDYFYENNISDKICLASKIQLDDNIMVRPDIFVYSILKQHTNNVPNWIIEVVSRSSGVLDYSIKMNKYRNAGVWEYWVVNPFIDDIRVYLFEKARLQCHFFSFESCIQVRSYPELWIDFKQQK